ncbi:tRNA pseudouridine(13) synthase TruD [Wenzhouxiangella marina]|uniref:tRNA pseudouridine synthase D n=1 Tax=Wenzhouxiangella marina TaxID=1579979 RepID=A0A0K0XYT1_9GAMM|nr:tRNA pseudouridine(13) synthase TruD [Wenzhouxiangella marina]AKS42781.1 TruD, tRNA pseudouridine synthase D [Wenzhouxiangella marina]MBB6087541.1 tRNA pseudouridine13 synthase [Wenzhouxiangella marina]
MTTESEFDLDGRAWGPVPGRGRIRVSPEDFRVREDLGHCPDGEGEHLWLWVEKRERNTVDVASDLARAAGVHPRQVSFAGLKDRNAVTEQYFSLHLPGSSDPDWRAWELEGVRIHRAERASRKIRRGRLKGNRFELRIRELDADRDALTERLERVRAGGVPNGFGQQRFGGNNLARARALFAGQLRRSPSKSKKGFYLSAARSLIFNQVLARRIAEGSWNRLLPGDVAMLDGTHSFFVADPDDTEQQRRCEAMDLHPTGPLVGLGEVPVTGEVLALETEVAEGEADLVEGLKRFRLEHQRRALRMRVLDLEWGFTGPDTLELRFGLGQGSYATSVLREILDLID